MFGFVLKSVIIRFPPRLYTACMNYENNRNSHCVINESDDVKLIDFAGIICVANSLK